MNKNQCQDFYSNQNMNNVKNISMSVSYNPENVWILLQENNSSEIIRLSDEKWIQSILINYSPEKNILSWENDTKDINSVPNKQSCLIFKILDLSNRMLN